MDNQENIIHEHKLHPSVIKLLWGFALILLLHALPSGLLVQKVVALDRSDISYCWDGATIEKQSNGNYKIRTYC